MHIIDVLHVFSVTLHLFILPKNLISTKQGGRLMNVDPHTVGRHVRLMI